MNNELKSQDAVNEATEGFEVLIGNKKLKTKVLFSEEVIQKRVASMAREIEDLLPAGEDIVVLIVLDGAILFAADLIRHLKVSSFVETVKLKSYHGMQSSGSVQVLQPVPASLKNKHVLVVEDIVDTGRSLKILHEDLNKVGVASVHVACLLAKPECLIEKVQVDFVGFSVGRNFVIGYGLDADGRYRSLPYIAEVLV